MLNTSYAPNVKESGRSTAATDSFSRTSSGSEGPPPLLDPELEDKFSVVVDGEVVVLDDVTQQARQVHKSHEETCCGGKKATG